MKSLFYLAILFTSLTILAQTPGEVGPITSISSYTTFQGYDESDLFYGEGEYQIYYDNIDGVFDKPLIIVDAFDPDDSNDISELYEFLTYNTPPQNYLDELRDTGVDIVILNFPTYVRAADGATINGGGDYIERNGLILVNLIETVNASKVGEQELIVVGPSMGGLVTRYALTYMEQNAMDHKAGLWVSFDSPHYGANIPISFQYAINYVAEMSADADMIELRDIQLNSAAAKQMLIDHYIPHLQAGSAHLQDLSKQLPISHDFRNTFMTELNSLGFPTETRNIAISNGSNNATMIETPGAEIMNASIDFGSSVGADMRLHYTPVSNTSDYEVDYIQPTYAGSPIGAAYYTYAESPAITSGLDSAPGGSILFESLFGNNPTGIQLEILNAMQLDAFSFIPSLSSMAIDEADWYDAIDGSESIPFDNYINGTDNEEHLTFTQEYVDFLNTEISNFYLNTQETAFLNSLRLFGNPVNNFVNFTLSKEYDNVDIQVLNTNGQMISSRSIKNDGGLISISSPKSQGVYFLKINSKNQVGFYKFIVR